jgi:hypothetical protein
MGEIERDGYLTGRIMSDAEAKGCEVCGEVKQDVKVRIDPFQLEVYGENIEMRLCDGCFQIRHDDV